MTETRLSDIVKPILFEPWEEPTQHWDFSVDAKSPLLKNFRRPSQPSIAIGKLSVSSSLLPPVPFTAPAPPPKNNQPYQTINWIRDKVAVWRKASYSGSSVKKLLTSWHYRSVQDEGDERPFFCQREAVETLAWLFTCKHQTAVQQVWDHLSKVNAEWNDGLNRIAIKMATGAGKTKTMAMLQAVLSTMHPNGCQILIITPNLTVQGRLQELQKDRHIVSVDYPKSARLLIVNFQKFHRRDNTFSGLDGLTSMHRKVLRTSIQQESSEEMIDRILTVDDKTQPLYVFQDEGHHCRRDQVTNQNLKDEELDNSGQWYQTLLALQECRNLQAVIDFSATPSYLVKPKKLSTPLFPWCVTDFSVEDAQESGICKIARLPVKDEEDTEIDKRLTDLYGYCQGQGQATKWGSEPPPDVQETFRALAGNWKHRLSEYEKVNRTPALIAVVNSIHNARVLYQWLAGSRNNEGWQAGAIEEFSNIDQFTLQPKADLPTLVVHSDINNSDELNADSRKVVDEQLELRASGKKRPEALNTIREIFQTVGKKGKRGEKIRCVISVAMLSEGWDAKTVTHVFGFRKFSSVLLCEQVIGRALRRPSLDEPNKPEYAEVVGIPYPGLIALKDLNGDSDPPLPPYEVFSLPENQDYRLYWPRIKSIHTKPAEGQRYQLEPALVREWKPKIPAPVVTDMRDPLWRGEMTVIDSRSLLDRNQTALYALARLLTNKWLVATEKSDTSLIRQGVLFVDAVKAISEWCRHPSIQIFNLAPLQSLSWREQLVNEVALACVNQEGERSSIEPVWDHPTNSKCEVFSDTSKIDFETTLKHRYPDNEESICQSSELNRAACHSKAEADIAAWLDSSELVRHWVRNFHLGWRLPWWDPATIQWREYEPDFLVELNTKGKCYVVIEMKGIENENSQNKEIAATRWCELISQLKHRECRGDWKYVLVTNPQELDNKLQTIGSIHV